MGALIHVQTQGVIAYEALVTGTFIAPFCVRAGTVERTNKVPCHALIKVLTVCSIALKAIQAVTYVGAISVEAV